ncbi:MAG TPA: hypothetical protein PKV55_09655 [Nitrospira sp.]|nr:hypothetical protein [Nitrospira sp.]HNA27369.1 hypothetical protein [Nitrospira sp.]HNI68293.1 hypothetical protein [Nitrospira sp.]HNL88658.1 hypothetical protein [Nitrospira sp.]HNN40901.1 hypothetical protein [Nitrospira sp.]
MNMMRHVLGTGLAMGVAVPLPVAHAEESAIPSDTVCMGKGRL